MARKIRVRKALRLRASGLSQNAIARAVHISVFCQLVWYRQASFAN